jgi:protein SCO1
MENKKSSKATFLWLALVIVIPMLAYVYVNSHAKLEVYNQLEGWNNPNDTLLLSNYSFIDQQSKDISLKSFPGKILVVNFFFSRCPGQCPKMMSGLKRVSKSFKDDNRVHFLSFTVDPEHDTPQKLEVYAEGLNINPDQWDLLTGDKRKIYRTARNGFHVDASQGNGGPQDFIHSDKIMLVDTNGNVRGYYSGIVTSEVNKLMTDVKKLENE